MNVIHWFRHDLRIADNPALKYAASQGQSLTCVFVINPRWFIADHYQSRHLGRHRWYFLQHSLLELDQALKRLGNHLVVMEGEPVVCLSSLIDQTSSQLVTVTPHTGWREMRDWHQLQEQRMGIRYAERGGCSLFSPEQLPFDSHELPSSFSKFRKIAEGLSVDAPHSPIDRLPASVILPNASEKIEHSQSALAYFQGGESKALAQLRYFTEQNHLVKRYKETRNGLDGRDYSSKLSPWLANGCLSATTAWHSIDRYERQHGANDSTYWMKFELLWREYFQWYAKAHGISLFRFDGIKGVSPNTSFFPERFARWCHGSTPYPIVNACMKQLNETGYMSNRGRQLVASCLVHELQLDWRFGAAYFEQQLIDFDVASNWGNWQYLAGVGADPRGHRRFDLQKQTNIYDPQGRFIARWKGDENADQPLDTVDLVDWPVMSA